MRRRPRNRMLTWLAASITLAAPSVVAIGSAAAQAPATNALAQATTREVEAVMADGTPGVAVLARNGADTQRIAAGRERLSPPRPLGTNAAFRAGSVTKSFVAAAILQQVDRGRLRLTDTVERRLPGVVPNGRAITIRQLLNHTSGLAEYATDASILAAVDANPNYAYALDALTRKAVALRPVARPGASFHYANTNYLLLGRILERVTGRAWTTQLRSSILRPLRLTDTSTPATARVAEPFVHGYVPGPGKDLVEATLVNPSFSGSAGMVTSTLDDLADFYRALLGGQVVGRRSLAAMKDFSQKTTIGRFRYGLGLERLLTKCGPVWGHDGELLGTSTLAFSSPSGDRQVVAVFNRGLPSAAQIDARLALLEKAYCADLRSAS